MGNKLKDKAYIFSGPDLEDISFLKNIDFTVGYLIAADCGLKNLEKIGLTPDVIIGDFDSFQKPTDAKCEVITFKIEKDDTDTMLCIKHALEKSYNDITIISGVGGRLDHTIANIQSLSYILSRGAKGRILSEDTEIHLLPNGEYSFNKKEGFSMSLFSYSERVSKLSVSGAKYNTDKLDIDNTFPIGVSNQITDDRCHISFESGKLLVIFSRL